MNMLVLYKICTPFCEKVCKFMQNLFRVYLFPLFFYDFGGRIGACSHYAYKVSAGLQMPDRNASIGGALL